MQLLRKVPTEILHLIKSREKVNREEQLSLQKKILSPRNKGKSAMFEGRFERERILPKTIFLHQVINKNLIFSIHSEILGETLLTHK